jgi:hypothetical protein
MAVVGGCRRHGTTCDAGFPLRSNGKRQSAQTAPGDRRVYGGGCLTLKVDRGITSGDGIDTLAELFAIRGVPSTSAATTGPSSSPTSFEPGSIASVSRRSTSSPVAPGRTSSPRASTDASVTSASPSRSSMALLTPGRSRRLGRTTTTTDGLTARLAFRPRPGSPPRVRLSPRPRPRLQPHTRLSAKVCLIAEP